MPDCYEFKLLINKLIDNEISLSEKKELFHHIENCTACRKCLERSKKLRNLLTQLPQVKTSQEFNVLLRARIRRAMNQESKKFHYSFAYPRRVLQFGFALVVILISLLVMNPFHLIRGNKNNQLTADEKRKAADFNGEIQYVIDRYPNSISLSRDDSIDSLDNRNDSLQQLRNSNLIKSHVTPVNF